MNDYDNLPETAKKLINQGLEDINEGRVYHEDVMAEFNKKYNLTLIHKKWYKKLCDR